MVDWMIEVLTTFKNSDQTFFLAVNLMDRYFKNIGVDKSLPSTELHVTGVVTMFIASKYEDIIPLLMRTIVNKIGHNKFSVRQIEEKELEILRVLDYRIGMPTMKEFLDKYLQELQHVLSPKNDRFYKLLMCLCKMTTFSYDLMQKPTSLVAAGVLINSLKIYDRSITGLRSSCDLDEVIMRICEVGE